MSGVERQSTDSRPPQICLTAPGHLASTPRLVKAADALAAAGYRVHVVTGRHFHPADVFDEGILARAKWSCTRTRLPTGVVGVAQRLLRQFARCRLVHRPGSLCLAVRAQHAGTAALVAAAVRVPAGFYFGHGGVAGLAAAAEAARRRNVPYGFDAEDWHEEERPSGRQDIGDGLAVRCILRSLLPGACITTCASPLIGEAFSRGYGVTPVCVLNVFPRSEAPAIPAPLASITDDNPAIVYWFSQTIGPERGLEEMIAVLGRMRTPAALHLRGWVHADFRRKLEVRAVRVGARPPVFLSPAPPADMSRLVVGASLGLSLEQSSPANRDLCLTNKIFTYLLAGVPVALTPTRAQRALAQQLGDAALMIDPSRVEVAAAELDSWFAHRRDSAAATAWRLGVERFNWDREQQILVEALAPHLRAIAP